MITHRTLTSTLEHLNRVATRETPQMLVQRHDDVLRLTTTGDVTASLDLPLAGTGWNGSPSIVPTKALLSAAKHLPKGDARLDRDEDGTIIVRGVGVTMRVHTLDREVQEATPVDDVDETPTVIPGSELSRALLDVLHAAGTRDYQGCFNLVRLHAKRGMLRAVATDGFRLAWTDTTTPTSLDVLIPASAVTAIARMLPKDALITIARDEMHLTLAWDGGTIRTVLPSTSWPNYEHVIPNDHVATLAIDAKQLTNALAQVLPAADKFANHRIELTLSEDGLVQLDAQSSAGSATIRIPLGENGATLEQLREPINAAYNGKYLADALKGMRGMVRVRWPSNTRPTLIENTYQHRIVVPLRAS